MKLTKSFNKAQFSFFLLLVLLAVTIVFAVFQAETVHQQEQKIAELEQIAQQRKTTIQSLTRENRSLKRMLNRRQECTKRVMAQAMLSETKRPREMVYVANVIRNRYESGFGGAESYHEVVRAPYQFSAFNPGSRVRNMYVGMDSTNTPWPMLWADAMEIAERVLQSDRSELPLPGSATHFYSPVGMKPQGSAPSWAYRLQRVPVDNVDHYRFRFYKSS